jgi:type I restriction enzyme S subunit
MNAEVLLKHFDRICDAPDAVPRLRQFILDLAVRGKLVEQNPSDEPTELLIQQLDLARHSITPRESGGAQPLPAHEAPFAIPPTWSWLQLGDVFQYDCGIKRDPKELIPERWLLELEDIERDTSVVLTRFIVSQRDSQSTKSEFAEGDILYGKLRPYLNKVVVATEPGYSTTEIVAIRPYVPLSPHYCAIVFRAPNFVDYVNRLGRGTKMPRLRTPDALVAPFPLPAVAEQSRIVDKVTELMGLCDRLEEVQKERESKQDKFTAATLQTLNSETDEDTVRENAPFFIKTLPKLTAHPHQIEELRQTILHLAVRGRLLHQSREEEPAPFFGITGETGEGRLDFTIPPGWSWARVADVADARLGKMLDKAKNSGRPFRYLRNTNVHWFDIRMDELKELKIEITEIEKYCLRPGDILICEGGHGIGRTAVWQKNDRDIVFQKALHRVRPRATLNSDFFMYCMFVYYHAGILQDYFTGVGIPHFTGQALAKLVFPLPPIAEQRRIVAKVKELFTLCEQLETNLAVIQAESHNLLDSVLYGAISSEAQ